jgi:hypothetical protein
MPARGSFDGRLQAIMPQLFSILPGMAAPGFIVMLDPLELGAQHDRLQFVQPAVVSHSAVKVPFPTAVVVQYANLFGQFIIVSDDHAAVAVAAEILTGEKGKAAGIAPSSGLFTPVIGPEGLGAILDQSQTEPFAQFTKGGQIRRLAEEMNRQNRPGPFGDGRLDQVWIEVEGFFVNIDEYRPGPQVTDRFGGGDKGKGAGDNLIPGSDPGCQQGQVQGVGAGRHANGVTCPAIGGDIFFEGRYIRSQNAMHRIENFRKTMLDFLFEEKVLLLEVNHGDLHEKASLGIRKKQARPLGDRPRLSGK